MHHRRTTSLLLGTAAILAGLLLSAELWWWLPPWPLVSAQKPGGDWIKLMVSADGRTLLGVQQGRMYLLDTATLRIQASCPFQYFPQGEAIEQFWLSADGRKVGYLDESADLPIVKLWNRDLQEEPIALPDCWSIRETLPASSTLITWGKAGYRLWDLHTARRLPLPIADGEAIRALRQLLDGRIVAIEETHDHGWLVAEDGLRVWDLSQRAEPVILRGARPPAVISPDGRLVASGSGERVQLWDPKSGRVSAVVSRSTASKEISAREFSPDGSRLVTTEQSFKTDGVPTAAIWDVSASIPRRVAIVQGRNAPWPSFSPDGRWIGLWKLNYFSGPPMWGIEVWGMDGEQRGNLENGLLHRPEFAPDGASLAGEAIEFREARFLDWFLPHARSAWWSSCLKIWEAPSCREIASFPNTSAFAYFPDGKTLAVERDDGALEVWPIPPQRPFLIDYGLPALFVFLVLLGIWRILRAWRAGEVEPADRSPEPVSLHVDPA